MGKISDAIRGIAMPAQKQTQMLYLDEEFVEMEAQIESLKLENRDLKAQVKPLEKKVERLEAQIEELTSKKEKNASHDELDEMAETLLKAIADSDGRMPRRETGAYFGLSQAKGDYYFDILRERGFIQQTVAGARGPMYGATPEGRRYLAKKGKL